MNATYIRARSYLFNGIPSSFDSISTNFLGSDQIKSSGNSGAII